MTGVAQVDDICKRYPFLEPLLGADPSGEWEVAFLENPDAMYRIIAATLKRHYVDRRHVGQRPMPREEDVDVAAMLHGQLNDRPIHEVLKGLMGDMSIRELARKVRMSHMQVYRVMKGEVYPDVSQLERIAKAVGKPPWFFVEYRHVMLVRAFVALLEEHPELATTLYRRYVGVGEIVARARSAS